MVWGGREAVTLKWSIAGRVDGLPGKAEASPGRTLFIPRFRNNRELFYTGGLFFSSQKR